MNELLHEGVKRRSGRWPWGSGENPYQHESWFKGFAEDMRRQGATDIETVKMLKAEGFNDVVCIRMMRKQGIKDTDIAKGLGLSTTVLRQRISIDTAEKRAADVAQAIKYKEKGYSSNGIAERMGVPEATVRNWLKNYNQDKLHILTATSDALRDQVDKKGVIDVGLGVEQYMGISRTKLQTAISKLKDEGYKVYWVPIEQLGTGKYTNTMVLSKPDISFAKIKNNLNMINAVDQYSIDGGRFYEKIEKPRSISKSEVRIVYAEDGGLDRDGLIEVRRGVDYLSLGQASYAQVRIGVEDKVYLKGMCVYGDNMPAGVNVRFYTNKKKGTPFEDVLKPMYKKGEDNPFGTSVKGDNQLLLAQRHFQGKDGKKELSALNIVNEEGNWRDWSSSLASQFLSKQNPSLIKQQIDKTYSTQREELDSILALNNPVIRKKLLDNFADGADSKAVSLKLQGLPRQASHVIVPFTDIKDNEIYAPNYKPGEKVVLVRYPHGGKFEIPELIVNNNSPQAKKALGNAVDAVGINSKVAERLSGADFDGDTVLVIPNNSGAVKNQKPLAGLVGFDPKTSYPMYEGMKVMSEGHKQKQMGEVSNLIADMTLKGAPMNEIEKAVKHSMVVIDAAKHKLNWKQSEIDNDIKALKEKWQTGGSSTLITRAKSPMYVDPMSEGILKTDPVTGKTKKQYVDPVTGEKLYTFTPTQVTKYKKDPRTGEKIPGTETVVDKKIPVPTMKLTKDARSLSSGTQVEELYAGYANSMKALANEARLASLKTENLSYSPQAAIKYAPQVESLKTQLRVAEMNKPRERMAQIMGNAEVQALKKSNPEVSKDELKKAKVNNLQRARIVTGASKSKIYITNDEWEAIQAGAIHHTTLSKIIDNADTDRVRDLATPRVSKQVSQSAINKALRLMANGYSQADAASAAGISVSTLLANV